MSQQTLLSGFIGEVKELIEYTSSHVYVKNVKIEPDIVYFEEGFQGSHFKQTISVKNCGHNLVFIKILQPTPLAFQISPIPRPVPLAPGLKITRTLTFDYPNLGLTTKSVLPVYVNNQCYNLPVIERTAIPILKVYPEEIDFGIVDVGNFSEDKTFTIENVGSKIGKFAIYFQRTMLHLQINPIRGSIQPDSKVNIKINILSILVGDYVGEFWIRSEIPVRVIIKAQVKFSGLRCISSPMIKEFSIITFPKSYYGTDIEMSILIKNSSTYQGLFCVLADIPGEIYELSEAKEKHEEFRMFDVSPTQGIFGENETKIFNLRYIPFLPSNKSETSNACIIKVIKLNWRAAAAKGPKNISAKSISDLVKGKSIEVAIFKPFVSKNLNYMSMELPKEIMGDKEVISIEVDNVVILLLEGSVEKCKVSANPTQIDLEEIPLFYTTTRILEIKNLSTKLPITCQFQTRAYIKVKAERKELKPLESTQFTINIHPKNCGPVNILLKFDLLFKQVMRTNYEKVGELSIPLRYYCVCKNCAYKHKDENHNNETEERNIESKDIQIIYKQENIGHKQKEIKYMQKEIANKQQDIKNQQQDIEDKQQATENQLQEIENKQRELESKELESKCQEVKSKQKGKKDNNGKVIEYEAKLVNKFNTKQPIIPKEFFEQRLLHNKCRMNIRGIELPPEYNLTSDELVMKQIHRNTYNQFVRDEYKKRQSLKQKIPSDYILTNKNLLLERGLSVPSCSSVSSKLLEPTSCDYPKIKPDSEASKLYIPLKPIELLRISISDRNLDLGCVARYSYQSTEVKLTNNNNFSIRARLWTGDCDVTFPSGDHFIIKANSNIKPKVQYWASKSIGYFDVLVYVIINDQVRYEFVLCGDITNKHLKVYTDCIEFKENDRFVKYLDMFNPFTVPVSFEWVEEECCFDCIPSSGTVPPLKHMICTIEYHPERVLPTCCEISLYSEMRLTNIVSISSSIKHPCVRLSSTSVSIPSLPLNISQIATVLLINYGITDSYFEVVNSEPIGGVSVHPQQGIIHKNSSFVLDININRKVCGPFECDLQIEIHGKYRLTYHISGEVVVPLISVSPEMITFRKIVPHSTDRAVFDLINKSSALAKVDFILESFKELSVSKTTEFRKEINSLCLKPFERKTLCLHYSPLDVSQCWIFLPMRVNDIIEPLDNNHIDIVQLLDTKIKEPKDPSEPTPPVLKVIAMAPKELISISEKHFHLRYFPNHEYPSCLKVECKIQNGSKDIQSICIRTDNLKKPIAIMHVSGNSVETYENALAFDVKEAEYVLFYIVFHPDKPGYFTAQLPIYVRNYYNCAVFNYITVEAIFPEAHLAFNTRTLYFEPTPLKTINKMITFLSSSFHLKDCEMEASCTDDDVIVKFMSGRKLKAFELKQTIEIEICYSKKTAGIVDATVFINCSCGASASINILGVCENCTVTNHAFFTIYERNELNIDYISEKSDTSSFTCKTLTVKKLSEIFEEAVNTNVSSFPSFPLEGTDSNYYSHMTSTVSILEDWIYSQGFYGNKFLNIPKGFYAHFDINPSSISEIHIPYLDLLQNLGGLEMVDAVKSSCTSYSAYTILDVSDRVIYIWNLYYQLKDMLTSIGGFLPHIEPELLLPYNHYIIYCKLKESNPLAPKEQHLLSKQNWLDLLLQTYKVLVKCRAKDLDERHCVVLKTLFPNWNDFLIKRRDILTQSTKCLYYHNLYHPIELSLLFWLEYIFNCKKQDIWSFDSGTFKPICLIDWDLCDGLVLAVVTATYAPYIIDNFKDMYYPPTCYAEKIYNAAVVLKTWESLQFTFEITVKQIVEPNPLQMAMLIAYLFDFLPSLYPNQELEMRVKLSHKTYQTINISNPNPFVVKYTAHFFQNSHNCFSVIEKSLIIKPHGSQECKIEYFGNRLKNVSAYIVFSGETFGYHYANSFCMYLKGFPDIRSGIKNFSLKFKTLEVVEEDLRLTCPYKVKAEYDIWAGYDKPPLDVQDLKIRRYSDISQYKLPFMAVTDNKTIKVNEDGCAKFQVSFISYPGSVISYYVYFLNDIIGDWVIHIQLNIVPSKITVPLHIIVPKTTIECECICHKLTGCQCPKILKVAIPHRHEILWASLEEMYFRLLKDDPDCLEFWKKYFSTRTGLEIFKIMWKTRPTSVWYIFQFAFTEEILNFSVKLKGEHNFAYPENITLPSSPIKEEFTELQLHYNGKGLPENVVVNLYNEKWFENRNYLLNFIREGAKGV